MKLIIFQLLMFTSFITYSQNDGNIDLSFNSAIGANGNINDVVLQPDGKMLIGGNFTTYNGISRNRIARLNADGSLDLTFDPGTGLLGGQIYAMVLQPDGKIIIAGSFSSYNGIICRSIGRLNTDGSLDTTFNTGLVTNLIINSISLQSDLKIIITGQFSYYNNLFSPGLVRINSDGSLDTTFNVGTGFLGLTWSSSLQPDGKILIGGSFFSYNGTPCNRIVRLNNDGSIDTSFDATVGANDVVYSIIPQSNGKILIGGLFTTYNGISRNRLAQLNFDGSLDLSFNPGLGANGGIRDMVQTNDGKIFIAGFFTSFNSFTTNRIARINTDGSLDADFISGVGFNSILVSVALQNDNKLITAGYFTAYNGTTRNSIARISSSAVEIITPEIAPSSCNSLLISPTDDQVFATSIPGATQYEFKIVYGLTEQTTINTTNSFVFDDFGANNFSFGITYQVSVRAYVNNQWTDFSTKCPVTLMRTTNVETLCNETMLNMSQRIYFEAVPNAQEYTFSITNTVTNVIHEIITPNRYFKMNEVPNYGFNMTFNVKGKVKVNGIYSSYGATCQIKTPKKYSQLISTQCGQTFTKFNETLKAVLVTGATSYKFRIQNMQTTQELESVTGRIPLLSFSNIQPNQYYNVSVLIKVDDVWLPYFGEVCMITTAPLPTTKLRSDFCGGSTTSLTTKFKANLVGNATNYRFKTTIGGTDVFYENANRVCRMSNFPGATINQTYSIQVAVEINGVWEPYGDACNWTVGTVGMRLIDEEAVANASANFNIKAYPNPFMNQITLALSNENINSDIMVYDMTGKLIQQVSTQETTLEIGNNWSKGVYLVQIVQGQETKNIRMVKQ
jgi:uncharacterized delta-60 repeat protein